MSDKIIRNKRVLVTGGAGFIGSNLCEELLKNDIKVVCLDNFSTGKKENIESLISNPNFKFIEGDIRNYSDCEKAVDGIDVVLHQAALGSVPRSIKDPMTSTDVNIGGFVKMLFAATEAGVKRFVYAASSSTYGDSVNMPKVEHIIGNPLSPYAITKYANEIYAKNFYDVYGIETIGLRYFNVFGRRQDPNGAYAAVIPKFVIQLMKHESPVINGDGTYSRDFTYIDNVIQANQLAATVDYKKISDVTIESPNIFNIAYGESTNLNELLKILKENLSKIDSRIANIEAVHGPNRAGDIPHSLANIDKGKEILGYKPIYDIRKGLKNACDWYWENLN
ncbi:SDR family oxidoreductase [Bacteroidota bacterium]